MGYSEHWDVIKKVFDDARIPINLVSKESANWESVQILQTITPESLNDQAILEQMMTWICRNHPEKQFYPRQLYPLPNMLKTIRELQGDGE